MSIPLGPSSFESQEPMQLPPTGADKPVEGGGQTPQGQAPVQSQTTAPGATLPRTEQPVQDQLAPSGQVPVPTTIVYAASAQGPVLPKPLEPKQEKKVEKEGTGNTDQSQQGDGSVQVDGEHKAHKEQEDSGGQSGGSGGGNTGSGKEGSGSGNFSGGGDNSRRESSGTATVDGSIELPQAVNAAAKVNATGAPDSAEAQEAAYLNALDPTGTAKISESGLYSPPVNGAQFFDNAGKIIQDITDMNLKFAEALPDGPEKIRFMDFLKVVQDALNQFQQLLRELQLNDSKGAKDRSQAQLEASLQKIENQREQQAEMAKKSEDAAKKAKIMGPLAILFAFLLAILLFVLMVAFLAVIVMTMPPLGLLVVTLIVAEFLDQCAKACGKKPFAIEGIANAVMAVIEALVSATCKVFGADEETEKRMNGAFKVITVAVIMAVSTVIAPGFMLFGGVTTLLSFLSASHAVKEAAMASGMEEADADKTEMYIGIVVGAAYAIAAFAVAFVLPVGGVTETIATFIRTVAQQFADLIKRAIAVFITMGDKVASLVTRTVQASVKFVMNPSNWVQATGLGLQTTNAVATYNYQKILADIAIIQGQMDSDIELKDATIQMLKKMIKQLLDGLQGIGDDIAAVGQSLKKTHIGVSQITSDLFG